jgi:UDP-N-acetylmuramate dehydrogenase
MKVENHFSLKKYNTFGIEASAREFVSVSTIGALKTVLERYKSKQKFILGGGSNMLLTKNIDAIVIHINLKGVQILKEDDNYAWVESQSGENWHEFVLWTIDRDLGGLENMSLIPGNVGTTPIQNIGAYGAEIKDVFESCKAIHTENMDIRNFNREECNFGYRESIFKNELKDQYIITSVVYKLTKHNHKISVSYGDIQTELARTNCLTPSLKQVSDAVIAIRKSKLPDPTKLGNSGSFFKNPILLKSDFEAIKQQFPEIRYYDISPIEVKIAAGWLIEQAGFKGKRYGDAGIHANQALVLVNYGMATGTEILTVARNIQETIFRMYGIRLETEVNIV